MIFFIVSKLVDPIGYAIKPRQMHLGPLNWLINDFLTVFVYICKHFCNKNTNNNWIRGMEYNKNMQKSDTIIDKDNILNKFIIFN